MNSCPLISVIVPVYKVERYLDKCVRSIMVQTYTNLEIILVDDGSPDNCPKMCDVYAREDTRIRVIHKENEGVSSARNAGVSIANGDYIGFVDSDDWIAPNMYELLIGGFTEHPDIGICAVCVKGINEDEEQFSIMPIPERERFIHSKDWVGALNLNTVRVELWNKLYPAYIVKQVPFVANRYAQDLMFNYQISDLFVASGLNYLELPQAVYYYRTRKGNITSSGLPQDRDALLNMRDLVYMWSKTHSDWSESVFHRFVRFCIETNAKMQLKPEWRRFRYEPGLDLREIPNRYVMFNFGKRFFISFLLLKYVPLLWRSALVRRWFTEWKNSIQ